MTYKVKAYKTREPKFDTNRTPVPSDEERLTGQVQSKPASDLEERFARALRKANVEFIFSYKVYTAVTVPGQDNEVDFLAKKSGVWYSFEIDGEIGHKTLTQKSEDAMRDIFVNEVLTRMGKQPIQRIPWTDLETQEEADRTVREVLRG